MLSRQREDRRQVGAPLPGTGRIRIAGTLFAPAPLAAPNLLLLIGKVLALRRLRHNGWRIALALDDHSRIAFGAILPDRTHRSAILFFLMARAYYARFNIPIRRVLTDNGSCYRDRHFGLLLHRQQVKHRLTRPYTPHTNGKAERFIQTALREWAYARSYQTSLQRHQQLDPWLHDYNFHRPHTGLNLKTPASRSSLNPNNLLTLHI